MQDARYATNLVHITIYERTVIEPLNHVSTPYLRKETIEGIQVYVADSVINIGCIYFEMNNEREGFKGIIKVL